MNGHLGMAGDLSAQLIRPSRPAAVRSVRIPGFGRVMLTRDSGDGRLTAREHFATNLHAVHRDGDGSLKDVIDLGSGLVTNVGVLALANDFNWAAPSGAAINTLKLANWHASGTGATAAATTDIKLQTPSTNGGQTPVSGAQSLVSAANSQSYRTVATISYTGSEAVTEWGLLTSGTLTATTGSPFTAGTATTGTVTATPLTASSATVQGQQQTVFDNTNATRVSWGLVTSNTTSVVTVPAWYKTADGTAGTAPVNADTYVIRPVLFDHKVFAAINVIASDTIQFTYTLAVNSGG